MIRTIVHFIDSPTFGGTEQVLLHLLAGLDQQRWRSVLLHHPEPALAPLLEGARRLGVETRTVPRMAGMRTVTSLPRFLRVLQAARPDVFHAHLCWLLSCKYGLLAAALARVPGIVATAHQYMEPPWGRGIALQQRLFQRCAERYIAVSQAVADQLCEGFGVPARKVQVIHNGIPCRDLAGPPDPALRTALSRAPARPIVLTVARLDQQKGHAVLFEAIRQLPDAMFVLAGDGPEKAVLEAKARALGIDDRVVLLGHRSDIRDLLAACDLFVLPSHYEGLPLAVLEAMAAGRAVVATAVGGVPEAVLNGVTGVLVRPRDPSALAKAIHMLLADPLLAHRMGAAARSRVEREFSSAAMVQRVTRIYEEVLERH
jgi:glycosyltransferase involved in cell wall biosynthesis